MVGFDDRLHHAVNVFFKNLIWISISNLLLLSVPDEEYFRNAWCALNYISTFLLLSVGRYLCWWTTFLLLSVGRYLCWWTIIPEGIIRPVVILRR